jgi:ketosteroid isomerase-like protein
MIRTIACFSVVLAACWTAEAQSPAAAEAAGQTTTQAASDVTTTASPEVQQFQKIEDKWSEAVNQHDQYGLELVLSPLFVDVSANGDITTRDQQVAQVINNDDKTLHLEQKVVTVRMLGDIAVANGTYDLYHKVNSSQVDEKGVFTQVYERARGGWMCINSQRTTLRAEANTNKKKSSTTEAGFHFPLFK